MPSLMHDSRKVAYSRIGSGTPVVLLHGSFATSSAWRKMLASLDTDKYCAIAVDLPGSGESEAGPFDASHLLSMETEAVEAVVAKETDSPIHLVAHSYGGVVALSIALRELVSLRSLTLFEPVALGVLADTAHADALADAAVFVGEYRRAFDHGDLWAARRVIDRLGGDGAFEAMPPHVREVVKAGTSQNICQWEATVAFRPPVEKLKALTVPTAIVCGAKSRSTNRWHIGERLTQLIANSRLVELAGAGHFMINTHAAQCASLIGPTDRCSGPADAGR